MGMSDELRRLTGQMLTLGMVALVAAGCEAPDPEPDMESAEPMMEEPMPEMVETTVMLMSANESGVSGEATAMHHNAEVMMMVEVEGLSEEGEYPTHIHEGTCETGGGVAAPLNPVIGLADGTGASTTTLDAADIEHDMPHFVQVHGLDGAPIACGDIEAQG